MLMLHFRTIDAVRLKNIFTGKCLTRGESNLVVKPCGGNDQRWDRWVQNKPFFYIHSLDNTAPWLNTNRCLSVIPLQSGSKDYKLVQTKCDYFNENQEWDQYNEHIYNGNVMYVRKIISKIT